MLETVAVVIMACDREELARGGAGSGGYPCRGGKRMGKSLLRVKVKCFESFRCDVP